MNKKILLVEDDTVFRKSVKDILELSDYEVIDVDCGSKALKIIQDGNVSLVITDILMPEMEGNELTAEIKNTHPNLKVIGMTGGGKLLDADRVKSICIPRHFELVLKKPFLAEEILEAVETGLA
jgi:DNA-binding NtrC family response regulator